MMRVFIILACVWFCSFAHAQESSNEFDTSISLYRADKPDQLNPEFAKRLAKVIVYAKDKNLITGQEAAQFTSTFRSQKDYQRLLADWLRNPTRFAHKPAEFTAHGAGFAVDFGMLDPISKPHSVAEIVIGLYHEGVYFPLLDDAVHVEPHPASSLYEQFERDYFARYNRRIPTRLSYSQQLLVIQSAQKQVQDLLSQTFALMPLSDQTLVLLRNFSQAINIAGGAGEVREDAALSMMADVIEGMYGAYRSKALNIPSGDSLALGGIYEKASSIFSNQRNEVIVAVAHNRILDQQAKLGGWEGLRPPKREASQLIERVDTRWARDSMGNPFEPKTSLSEIIKRARENQREKEAQADRQEKARAKEDSRSREESHTVRFKLTTGRIVTPEMDFGEGEVVTPDPPR